MRSPSDLNKKSSADSESLAEIRAFELSDLITHFAPKQPLSEFSEWHDEFVKISQANPENRAIQESYSRALKNATRMFGERRAFADMLNILDELEELYEASQNEVVCENLADSLSTAIMFMRGSWDTEGTSKFLNRLHLLVKRNPKNQTVVYYHARSYASAINRFCSDRQNFICDRLLFEFRMFANKYRDLVDVQIEFAQALTNLIGTLARDNRIHELNQILEELRRISGRFPDNEKIQLLITRANILSSLATNKND
ncbi:MAG TPA: hypothetical protein VMZ29_02690 [Candidatus Bathyarchaeia archaeon]|nr:hypothetical protein [Candidatus Bathyarchaeia archaeon]